MQCAGRSLDEYPFQGLLDRFRGAKMGCRDAMRCAGTCSSWCRDWCCDFAPRGPPATRCPVSRREDRKSSALPVAPLPAPAAIRWSEAAAQMMKTEIEVKVLTKDYPSVLPHAHDCLLLMMSDRASSGIAQSIGDPLGCLSPFRPLLLPLLPPPNE